MAITRVQSASGAPETTGSNTTLSATWGTTTTSGNLLVAVLGFNGNPGTITPPTNWVQIGSIVNNGSAYTTFWYIKNAAAQLTAQTWNWTNSVIPGLVMAEYSGIDTTAPLDVNTTNNGSSTSPSTGTVSPGATTYLAIGGLTQSATSNTTISFSSATNSYTIVAQNTNTQLSIPTNAQVDVGLLEKIGSLGASTSTGVTSNTNSTWSGVIATFKIASGGSSPTKTHTTNALLKALNTQKTHTTNALLKATNKTKTHTTAALLASGSSSKTKTHTANALLKASGLSKTHTTSALLKAINKTKTHTANALLASGTTSSTKTHTTNALLKSSTTKTHTTNALLKASTTKTHTTSALLKGSGTTKSHTTAALLKASGTQKTHTTGALLKGSGTNQFHSTNALLKASGTSKTHTTSALLKASNKTKTHTTNALLLGSGSVKAHTTNALLKASGTAKTHTTNALLKAVGSKTHSTNALLVAGVITFTGSGTIRFPQFTTTGVGSYSFVYRTAGRISFRKFGVTGKGQMIPPASDCITTREINFFNRRILVKAGWGTTSTDDTIDWDCCTSGGAVNTTPQEVAPLNVEEEAAKDLRALENAALRREERLADPNYAEPVIEVPKEIVKEEPRERQSFEVGTSRPERIEGEPGIVTVLPSVTPPEVAVSESNVVHSPEEIIKQEEVVEKPEKLPPRERNSFHTGPRNRKRRH